MTNKLANFDLFVGSAQANLNLVKMALAEGADVNALSPEGFTALQLLCYLPEPSESGTNTRNKICELLIDAGADVDFFKNGDSVLDLAIKNHFFVIAGTIFNARSKKVLAKHTEFIGTRN